MDSQVRRVQFGEAAAVCGFELAGACRAESPDPEFSHYQQWVSGGNAGRMGYLTDHRGALRADPRLLLPSARSVLCVGKLYNAPGPVRSDDAAWISKYAWGADYHDVMKVRLERLVDLLREWWGPFESKVCVDTAPLLERALARRAGLGWIAKNTCLINEPTGSWYFLGEVLVSVEVAPDSPPPDRCGTCTRCIDACPTGAIVDIAGMWSVDSRRCISYHTIELKGEIHPADRPGIGGHIFGCDICQDVCPWNSRAPVTAEPAFQPLHATPVLEALAALSPEEFRDRFRSSPVWRTKYQGFLRNVAIAMGNLAHERYREPLQRLAAHPDPVIAAAATWALSRL